jgi:hypothetical protein
MKAPVMTSQRLISSFMQTHCIPLRLRKPRFWQQRGDAYYDTKTFQFTLPINARGAELKEFIFHEMGHALLHQFCVPKHMISQFSRLSPYLPRPKAIKLMTDSQPSPKGWVSWYAMTSGTEDFCETLGAWAANNYKAKGLWRFNNFVFDIGNDRLLQRKIRWVQQIVELCYFQAHDPHVTLYKKKSYHKVRVS